MEGQSMRLYHVTDRESAERIVRAGFVDSEVIHDDRELQIGVWLADRCLAGENDVGPRLGPVPDTSLSIEVPPEAAEPYERREDGKPYREFCVPARILNEYGIGEVQALEDVAVEERRRLGEPLEAP
jgi:hypothetical protein